MLLDDQKQSQIQIQGLKEENEILKAKVLSYVSYRNWNHHDLLRWIVSLENGRFMKYAQKLRSAFNEEEPSGKYLGEVNEQDIRRWGINKFMDIKDLKQYIDDLVNKEEICNEGAPNGDY